jgi:hypothetical protein
MKTTLLLLLFVLFTGIPATAQSAEKKATTEKTLATPALTQFTGTYASADNSDIIAVFENKEKLMCKIPGKPTAVLEYMGRDSFKSDKDNIQLKFDTKDKQLEVKQGDKWQTYKKE